MLKKIISGGQTGADQAGLRAARALGIETGGWMPKGFLTENGKHPEFAELYGMVEHSSARYAPRTKLNVAESDATLVFGNIESPGSVLTWTTCNAFKKPWLHIGYRPDDPVWYAPGLIGFLKGMKVETLNIAGNRESKNPGIGDFVYHYLVKALGATDAF